MLDFHRTVIFDCWWLWMIGAISTQNSFWTRLMGSCWPYLIAHFNFTYSRRFLSFLQSKVPELRMLGSALWCSEDCLLIVTFFPAFCWNWNKSIKVWPFCFKFMCFQISGVHLWMQIFLFEKTIVSHSHIVYDCVLMNKISETSCFGFFLFFCCFNILQSCWCLWTCAQQYLQS